MTKLLAKAFVEKAEENGILEVAIASDGVVDRHGEVIDQAGWDFKNFKKNPVFLWSHNSGMGEARPPIGKVKKLWFEGSGKKQRLMFQPQFDLEDSFAKDIYRKYRDGFLNAFSVGFIPLEAENNTYTKSELLEISAVPIPANPNAIVSLSKTGMKSVEWKDLVPEKEEAVEKEIITDYETWKSELDSDHLERLVKEIERETEKRAFDAMAKDLKDIAKEIRQNQKPKKVDDSMGLKEIADFMRILNQATAIGLKKVKEIKSN